MESLRSEAAQAKPDTEAQAAQAAAEQLRKSISSALATKGLDNWTRQRLEGMLDNIDSKGEMGDNKKTPKNLANYNFNKYLMKEKGPPPADMVDPHAHHIVFKEGLGEAQKALVREAQEILREYGIDPIFGLENLVWAPNRIAGQHDYAALKNVVDQLMKVVEFGGTDEYIRNKLIKRLSELGKLAARRR